MIYFVWHGSLSVLKWIEEKSHAYDKITVVFHIESIWSVKPLNTKLNMVYYTIYII